jgi:hypothetical protein
VSLSDESFEKLLLRTILFIDRGQRSIDHLSGVLTTLRGTPNAGRIEDARVLSLEDAQTYINEHNPYIVIIDPAIASIQNVLTFIESNRQAHPRTIWVINAHRSWWREHDTYLGEHPFGNRLKEYFRLNKDVAAAQIEADFKNTLALCRYDFVLGLLGETAAQMRQGTKMSKAQITKFAQKALADIRSLNLALQEQPSPGETAFVSMQFTEQQRRLYNFVIARVLREEGLTPVMIAEEYPSNLLIPPRIFSQIELCSLFVADLTGVRANVMIELGAAWALQKPIILLADEHITVDALPFLLRNARIEFYSSDQDLYDKLHPAVNAKKPVRGQH